jgi:hypothetical protein
MDFLDIFACVVYVGKQIPIVVRKPNNKDVENYQHVPFGSLGGYKLNTYTKDM